MPLPAAMALRAVKLVHTAIWLFFVCCILGIFLSTAGARFGWATGLSGVVLMECLVLVVNGGRCPLTDIARNYSDDQSSNFDIYLPIWLAHYNKWIFGVLFAAAELYLLLRRTRLLP